jgi:hypothetical protein
MAPSLKRIGDQHRGYRKKAEQCQSIHIVKRIARCERQPARRHSPTFVVEGVRKTAVPILTA